MPDTGRWSTNGGDPSLNEIRQADRFLDSLAADQPVYSTDAAEAELAFLLADWRDGIRDPAVTTPLTARDAVAALQKGLHRKESRGSLAIVGSVAAALLCLGGFGTAIYAAGPGDALYGLHATLFGAERVSDEQVMLAAQTQMQEVQQMIDNGQWQQAQDKLQALSPTVQSIDTPEHKQQLIQQWNALTYKVVEQDPAATLPPAGEPLPPLPSSPLTLLPVPAVVEPPQQPTTTTSTATTSTSSETSTSPSGTNSTSSTSPSSGTTSTSPSSGTTTTEPSSGTTTTAPSSTSPTETSASESATASSPTTSTTASQSPVPSTAPSSTAPSTTASSTASASSSEQVATNPATAGPSSTQPAQTQTTVAPTVATPTAATPASPAPTTKEAQQPPTRERSAQQSVTTTTEVPMPSGRGQH
ncbi:MAG: anti-sigma-D factor RsdA [Mycobacterium sp.]|nr:anti-sigma-D factor RsdA [Mycobacterium sp.]